MKLYAIVRTSKMLDLNIMFVGSYNNCSLYLKKLKNDKKYDSYNKYHHRIEPITRYRITVQG